MSDSIAIDDAVDMELLQKIHEQYLTLGQQDGIVLQEFGAPNLTGKDLLIAYHQYLKGLSWSLRDRMDCKPCSPGGGCPPCYGWTRSQYENYLQQLSTKSAGG